MAFGESPYLRGRDGKSLAQRRIERIPSRGHFVSRDTQLRWIYQTVESRSEAQQCSIALMTHAGYDAAYGRQHGIEG